MVSGHLASRPGRGQRRLKLCDLVLKGAADRSEKTSPILIGTFVLTERLTIWPEIFNINSTTTLTLPNASSAQLYISMSARFRIVDAAMRFHSCR